MFLSSIEYDFFVPIIGQKVGRAIIRNISYSRYLVTVDWLNNYINSMITAFYFVQIIYLLIWQAIDHAPDYTTFIGYQVCLC